MAKPRPDDDGASRSVAVRTQSAAGESLRRVLTAALWVAAVVFVASLLFAVLTEMQGDYLGARAEAAGAYDPTVFPPHDGVTWLMAMAAPVVTGVQLALVVAARRMARGISNRSSEP